MHAVGMELLANHGGDDACLRIRTFGAYRKRHQVRGFAAGESAATAEKCHIGLFGDLEIAKVYLSDQRFDFDGFEKGFGGRFGTGGKGKIRNRSGLM